MKQLIKNTLLTCIISLSIQHHSWGAQSTIFTWDGNTSQVHSNLNGDLSENNWYAENVKSMDLQFYQSLFTNETVMKCFGDGQTRTPETTQGRINFWIERFERGQPHGGMTVFQTDHDTPIGYIVAGGGDEPGVSEIAYAYIPEVWGKGIGSNVVEKIVTEWAPEVRRIGLGTNLDENRDAKIISTFRCFDGKILDRLDATASPSNPASWKILVKNNFHRAYSCTSEERPIIEVDVDHCHTLKGVDYKAMEEHILQKYYAQDAISPLEEGIRYLMIDPEGNEKTLSKHKGYSRLKYHFEYHLPQ